MRKGKRARLSLPGTLGPLGRERWGYNVAQVQTGCFLWRVQRVRRPQAAARGRIVPCPAMIPPLHTATAADGDGRGEQRLRYHGELRLVFRVPKAAFSRTGGRIWATTPH